MTQKLHHFYYSRNTKSLGKQSHKEDYGQKIEPHGEYMNIDPSTRLKPVDKNWETGTISFKKPLFLEHIDSSSQGWKKTLSDKFEGKTGKELSQAVKDAGHDAVITKDKYGHSETVNFGGQKNLYETLPREIITSENRDEFIKNKLNK